MIMKGKWDWFIVTLVELLETMESTPSFRRSSFVTTPYSLIIVIFFSHSFLISFM